MTLAAWPAGPVTVAPRPPLPLTCIHEPGCLVDTGPMVVSTPHVVGHDGAGHTLAHTHLDPVWWSGGGGGDNNPYGIFVVPWHVSQKVVHTRASSSLLFTPYRPNSIHTSAP